MDEYVNEMRSKRMGGPAKSVAAKDITVSHEGQSVKAPSFEDAGTFLKGGGKCDGEMENIGTESSVPKGSSGVGRPTVEKGAPGPEGPGVI